MNDQLKENKKQLSEKELNRRNFLMKVSFGFAALSATVAAIPVISALAGSSFGTASGNVA